MGKNLSRLWTGALSWALACSGVSASRLRLSLLVGIGVLVGAHVCAQSLPLKAKAYGPELVKAQGQIWWSADEPWTMAGQVEQESCISLKHPKCWDPRAELKTPREYGFGFGQITKAYNKDGSVRFDKFSELVAAYPTLSSWTWEKRFDAEYQFKALVELDKTLWARLEPTTALQDRWAFTLSAYNGGVNGVLRDQLLCQHRKGCDPKRWFGHVETDSIKSKVVMPGYGKSPFTINREYPRLVLERRQKYRGLWEIEE